MATVTTVVRPTQALRQRRTSERPGIARVNTRATTAEAMDSAHPAMPPPLVMDQAYILRKHNGRPPSLVVQLHQNHFKFLQQDGTFPYNSPMKFFLEHLRKQTLPHDMLEELYASDVPFYDGCLIVEVQDFRSGQGKKTSTTTNVGGTDVSPFSVHNWNEHITPSPFVPFPDKFQMSPGTVKKEALDGPQMDKAADKENMPAPDQPASASQKKLKPVKIFTIVLFPTAEALEEDISILARTPLAEARTTQRILQAKSRDGLTPTLPHPPTPLASVPSTPITAKSMHKKPKMVLDENSVHEFEAEVLLRTNPVLYLEPARDAYESDAIIAALTHPLHSGPAPMAKTRKRTIAEVAADQAQAAEEERFMLSFDERHQSTNAGSSEGQTAGTSLEQPFKRFKTLETIKSRHTELEREKKEAAQREAILKRQQNDAESERRKHEEQQARLMQLQTQKQIMDRQKLAQAQAQAQAAAAQVQAAQAQAAQMPPQHTPVTSHAQQMMTTQAQHQMQMSQAPAMSPVVRQGTPQSASSPMIRGGDNSAMGLTSVPMGATASNQGAGSPARPASAISHHPGGAAVMARQMSHQNQQIGSAHGTPQMANTPHMGAAVPNRMMTPVPRAQQGSPVPGAMQATPMMPTASFSGLTAEQIQQRRAMMLQMAQQQQGQQTMGGQMSPQNMQQMIMMQRQQAAAAAQAQQAQQMGMANPGQQQAQMQIQQAALQRQIQMQAQQRQMMQNMQQQPGQNANMMAMQNQMANANAQDNDPNSPRGIAMRWRMMQINTFKQALTQEKQQFMLRQPTPQDIQQFDGMQQQRLGGAMQRLNQQTQQKLQEETTKRQAFLQQRQAAMQQQGMAQQGNPMAAQAGNPMAQMNMAQMGNGQINQAYIAQMQQQQRKLQLQQMAQHQKLAQMQQMAQSQGMMQGQGMPNMQNMTMQQQQQLLQQMQLGNMNAQGMGGGMNVMPGQMGPGQGMGM